MGASNKEVAHSETYERQMVLIESGNTMLENHTKKREELTNAIAEEHGKASVKRGFARVAESPEAAHALLDEARGHSDAAMWFQERLDELSAGNPYGGILTPEQCEETYAVIHSNWEISHKKRLEEAIKLAERCRELMEEEVQDATITDKAYRLYELDLGHCPHRLKATGVEGLTAEEYYARFPGKKLGDGERDLIYWLNQFQEGILHTMTERHKGEWKGQPIR